MINLNAVAKKHGFEFARDTGIEKDGYKIYSLGFSQPLEVGLPSFLLVKDGEIKIIDGLKGKEFHHWLCVNCSNNNNGEAEDAEEE